MNFSTLRDFMASCLLLSILLEREKTPFLVLPLNWYSLLPTLLEWYWKKYLPVFLEKLQKSYKPQTSTNIRYLEHKLSALGQGRRIQ